LPTADGGKSNAMTSPPSFFVPTEAAASVVTNNIPCHIEDPSTPYWRSGSLFSVSLSGFGWETMVDSRIRIIIGSSSRTGFEAALTLV
jgi:hypothetical protein